MRNIKAINIITIFILSILCMNTTYSQSTSPVRAGIRSSTYGINPFPNSDWWFNATSDMAAKYPGSEPAVIWILGYTTNNGCYLNFPNPTPGTNYSRISFGSSDKNENYLNDFDSRGVKVWLQVEPGLADVETLINLVLTKYGHHSSIVGFGVDVEWYKTSQYNEGKAVTDAEAEAWATKVRSFNQDYLLFTKHWLINKMPPTYRTGIVFVDDSQIFPNMQSMIDEFEDWANAFSPADVAFQYGYNSDKVWWQNLSDPPKDIGDAIMNVCPNTSGLFWVDFTAYTIWPQGFTSPIEENENTPTGFKLNQNYPNPFNPETTISFSIASSSKTKIDIFDVQGRLVKEVYSGDKAAGNHSLKVKLNNLNSGIYFCRLSANENVMIRKMTLLK